MSVVNFPSSLGEPSSYDFPLSFSPLAKLIFNENDTPLLNNLFDDNQKIEPQFYMPIIPMVLVNGAEGIGTGWSTKIPNYNPREIIENIKRLLSGDEPLPMVCSAVLRKTFSKAKAGFVDMLSLFHAETVVQEFQGVDRRVGKQLLRVQRGGFHPEQQYG